jgi:hypothetical protein
VRTVLEELILWRRPLHTALWLTTLALAFFLVVVSEYSLLTLVCYLVLIQLAATSAAMRGAPMLKTVGLLRASFDPKTFAAQRQAFTSEEVRGGLVRLALTRPGQRSCCCSRAARPCWCMRSACSGTTR